MGKPASSCLKIMGCGGGGADAVDNGDLLPEEVNFVLVFNIFHCDWGSPIRIVGVEGGRSVGSWGILPEADVLDQIRCTGSRKYHLPIELVIIDLHFRSFRSCFSFYFSVCISILKCGCSVAILENWLLNSC